MNEMMLTYLNNKRTSLGLLKREQEIIVTKLLFSNYVNQRIVVMKKQSKKSTGAKRRVGNQKRFLELPQAKVW